MSFRVDLASAVMAALALIILDATTAQAYLSPCEVMPERCRYESDGGYYFYYPEYRMPDSNHTLQNRAVRSQSHRRNRKH